MRARAFTLIELLVVVAIVTLLISILLPALNRARQQGKATVCLSHLRSLGTALQTYLQTNGDRFPGAGLGHGAPNREEGSWVSQMLAEIGRRGGERDGAWAGATLRGEVRDVRRCPSDGSPHFAEPRNAGGERIWRQTSYASNYYFAVPQAAIATVGKSHAYDRIDRVPRPATTIFWAEMAEQGEYATADHFHPELWFGGDPRVLAGRQLHIERHARRANYGMVDGHAEPLTFERAYLIDVAGSDPGAGRIAWFHNLFDPDVAR